MKTLIRYIPGRIGGICRQLWFGRRFKNKSKIHIEIGCEFLAPQSTC